MSTPTVSVLMPVYNGEQYLAEAIESVLNQSFTDFEFIIINDGSTDGSKAIILSYKDKRIRYVENDENIRLVNTLNKGIDLCRGEYIARMDADDVCLPNRLEQQVGFMRKHPSIGVCGSWVNVIDGKGSKTSRIVNQTKPELIKINLLFSVPLVHPSTIINASLLKQNKYNHTVGTEDYDLWCRLADQTNITNISSYLLLYRWHESNVSKENEVAKEFSKQITMNEISKLGLNPSDEDYRIHKLSFTLYAFHGDKQQNIGIEDLNLTGLWFNKLLIANRKVKRFNHKMFIAFLWSRWILLCFTLKQKQKIFTPPFASYYPKVLLLLFQQLLLLSKKKNK